MNNTDRSKNVRTTVRFLSKDIDVTLHLWIADGWKPVGSPIIIGNEQIQTFGLI